MDNKKIFEKAKNLIFDQHKEKIKNKILDEGPGICVFSFIPKGLIKNSHNCNFYFSQKGEPHYEKYFENTQSKKKYEKLVENGDKTLILIEIPDNNTMEFISKIFVFDLEENKK